jgi:ArsR family metal-binding transcriptional regulator
MSVGIEDIENFIICDDIDFEIIKYVDKIMNYNESTQKDILHQIVKHAVEYRYKKEKLETLLEEEKEKYNTLYDTNVILINQLKCAEKANNMLSSFNQTFIQEKHEKRDFIKKLMKYGFMFGSIASVAGFFYVSKKS